MTSTNQPIHKTSATLTPRSDTAPVVVNVRVSDAYLMHITGGAKESTNPFGHTALAVGGIGMYSYGNNTLLGGNALKYIQEQSKSRLQQVTIIPITNAQHGAIVKYFNSKPGMNSVGYVDNCAVRTAEALISAGIPIDSAPFPGDLAKRTMKLSGVQTFTIQKNGSVPHELTQFINQYFSAPNLP